ncbi:MAG: hypothetical protein P4M01_01570 [Acidobacteriota bacterium]|nr:hypothetical protein [Acidobacteriota bacterium]
MKKKFTMTVAALLLSAALPAAPNALAQTASKDAPASQAPAARKQPQPKTQAEYDAFKTAAALQDPGQLEAAASDFAQRFTSSELRAYLFQMAMGAYQNAGNTGKALEMARAVVRYDPENAVALATAGQILAERTHDDDLDRDDRLQEASADAKSALLYSASIPMPANMTPEQFAAAMAQLRGTAHEVQGTVFFKRADYFNAIKEYNAAVAEEKEHTDAVVYLRLAVANDKTNDLSGAQANVDKALGTSETNSEVHQLAAQEKDRLRKLATVAQTAPATEKK